MQTLEAIYQNWMVKERGYDANTIHAYLADYRDWANWCKNDESLIKDPMLLDFDGYFNEKLLHLKANSILRKYQSLRRFYRVMVVLQVISRNPIDAFVLRHRGGNSNGMVRRIMALPQDELERLTCIRPKDSLAMARDKMVLALIHDTGLSPTTLIQLQWEMDGPYLPGRYLFVADAYGTVINMRVEKTVAGIETIIKKHHHLQAAGKNALKNWHQKQIDASAGNLHQFTGLLGTAPFARVVCHQVLRRRLAHVVAASHPKSRVFLR
jgi:site-specific recombinase XerC